MRIIIGILFLIFSASAYAQTTWLVLAVEGKVKNALYKNKEKVLVKKLWAGDTLRKTKYIDVPQQSYIALAHLETGKVIEINQSGVYKLEDVLAQNSSVFGFSNAFGIAVAKLHHANRELPSERMLKYEPIAGSVERCRCGGAPDLVKPLFPAYEAGLEKEKDACIPILQNNLRFQIYIDTSVLRNSISPIRKTYTLEILNFLDKKIHAEDIRVDSSVQFELNFQELKNKLPNKDRREEDFYLLGLYSPQDKIPAKDRTRWCLEKVPHQNTPSDKALIYQNLLVLEKKLEGNPTAIGYVLMAILYEQEYLFLDACASYQKALSLQPSVTTYQNLYHNFLYDNYFIMSRDKNRTPIFFVRKIVGENTKKSKKTLR